MDNLIDLAKSLSEQVEAGRPAAEQAESSRREQQVQALVSVEDTIQANPKLAHLRATDPAAFNDLADIDTMLRDRAAWKDKPLAERFDAAVRMYEAANGAIELPGQATKAAPAQPSRSSRPRCAGRGESPGRGIGSFHAFRYPGRPAGRPFPGRGHVGSVGSALTDHFMTLSPDELEAQLARLSS